MTIFYAPTNNNGVVNQVANPAFGDRDLVLERSSKTRFELVSPTDYVGYQFTSGNGQSITTKFYDADGDLIDSVIVNAPGNGTILDVSFLAPKGEGIAYFEIEVSNGGTIHVDNFEWGAPLTSKVNEEADSSQFNQQTFVLDNIEEFTANEDSIVGSDNIDTLVLSGADQILDLTALANKVTSIEIIDLTGTGNNTLNLSLGDVLAQGDSSLFTGDSATQMMIKGNAGDVVNLDDLLPDGTDPGDWATVGTTTVAGVTYNVYQHSTLDAQLLVQDGVTTNLV